MTQRQVAERMGVSVPYLSDVERGKRGPFRGQRLVNLAHVLEGEAAGFLGAIALDEGFVGLPLGKSDERNNVAAMLSDRWLGLTLEQLDQIADVLRHDSEGNSTAVGALAE